MTHCLGHFISPQLTWIEVVAVVFHTMFNPQINFSLSMESGWQNKECVSVEASGECVPVTKRRGRMSVNRPCVYGMNGKSPVSAEIGREELHVPSRPGASRGNVCL